MRVLFVVPLIYAFQGASGFAPSTVVHQKNRVTTSSPSSVVASRTKTRTKTNLSASTSVDKDDICTVQILMSDTGGGHRASANALRDAFDTLHPGKIQCDIVDIYTDYGPFFPYNSYVPMYKFMARYPITWDIFYHFGCTPFGLWLNEFLLDTFCFKPFLKCLARPSGDSGKRADMVVSVHPLTQDIPLKILAFLDSGKKDLAGRRTPFCTVVTDLGSAHPTWFNPGVDKCFVPSDALYQAAKDRKLRDDQIVKYGLPIRRGFWASHQDTSQNDNKQQLSPESLRKELGLDEKLPTVLIVGGGDGMGGIVDISQALGKALGDLDSQTAQAQMVVVCGKNEQAKSQLQGQSWGAGVRVNIQGFVNNMDEWMRASDALVTKAGPGTIAEAAICGLPCMMFAYLPGQEAGNIPFVEQSGFGKYSGDPAVIAETVTSWLSSPEMLQEMRSNALAAARPDATLDIARDLADIVLAQKQKTLSEAKVRVR
jgi:1,2-diacylglycerol 3-beta-galactosyltransferase